MYFSPKSFTEAWGSGFFSSAAIMLVTAVGLITDSLPLLHNLPIGGRLIHCVYALKLLTTIRWVRNVVQKGYQIPLLFKPWQSKEPGNPKATNDDAHQVLVTEAQGLLDKCAIQEATPTSGQFISSYFAVPKPCSSKWRPILNLKHFNAGIRHYKFKMETFKKV